MESDNPISSPSVQPTSEAVPSVQSSPEDIRKQQINGIIQTSSSILRIILKGLSRISGEILSMIAKR